MKKKTGLKLLTGIAALAGAFMLNGASAFAEDGVSINANTFPDEVFRGYVTREFDLNQNGLLEEEEIKNATCVDLHEFSSNSFIGSLKGIEYLTNLQVLLCYGQKIETLDLSKNTVLQYVDCDACDLTDLDVSMLSELETLHCGKNYLSNLDVSNNIKLKELSCSHNGLSRLDVTKNKSLQYLYCWYNSLKELNLKENTNMKAVACCFNELTYLNLSENNDLTAVYCYGNNLAELNISCCPELVKTLTTGQINSRIEKNVYDHENFEVTSYKRQLNAFSGASYLEVDTDTRIVTDEIPINEITFPDEIFRAYVATEFDTNQNRLLESEEIVDAKKIDLRNLTTIGDGIKTLKGIEYLTNLEQLDCANHSLYTIDLSKNTELKELDCGACELTELDISALSKLTDLYCDKNHLTTLDVSENTSLQELYCVHNNLTDLDVTNNTLLKYLDCSGNALKELDLEQNSALKVLYCTHNALSALNIKNNKELYDLKCSRNNIRNLNVSACPKLLVAVVGGEVDVSEETGIANYIYSLDDSKYCLKVDSFVNIITQTAFPDVALSAWYNGVVTFVAEQGFMKGKVDSNGNLYFAPNDPITRAEFATVLYNKEGKPDVEYTEQFGDVKDGKWFTKPVMWVFRSNIAKGYGNNLFGVSDNITREQMAQMFYAYARFKGYDMNVDGVELDRFADPDQVSSWAVTAMKWATSRGVINGTGDEIPKLNPLGSATRAECAAMIRNFVQKVEANQ